jgi:hypothetical protein
MKERKEGKKAGGRKKINAITIRGRFSISPPHHQIPFQHT